MKPNKYYAFNNEYIIYVQVTTYFSLADLRMLGCSAIYVLQVDRK